jgi:hypothetical protein
MMNEIFYNYLSQFNVNLLQVIDNNIIIVFDETTKENLLVHKNLQDSFNGIFVCIDEYRIKSFPENCKKYIFENKYDTRIGIQLEELNRWIGEI